MVVLLFESLENEKAHREKYPKIQRRGHECFWSSQRRLSHLSTFTMFICGNVDNFVDNSHPENRTLVRRTAVRLFTIMNKSRHKLLTLYEQIMNVEI